jgi:hypothetical protein
MWSVVVAKNDSATASTQHRPCQYAARLQYLASLIQPIGRDEDEVAAPGKLRQGTDEPASNAGSIVETAAARAHSPMT